MATTITKAQLKAKLNMKGDKASVIITVKPSTLRKFLEVRAKMNSAKREMDKLKIQLNLPEVNEHNEGEYVLTDSNGQYTAKYTIYYREGFNMPSGFIGKVS